MCVLNQDICTVPCAMPVVYTALPRMPSLINQKGIITARVLDSIIRNVHALPDGVTVLLLCYLCIKCP